MIKLRLIILHLGSEGLERSRASCAIFHLSIFTSQPPMRVMLTQRLPFTSHQSLLTSHNSQPGRVSQDITKRRPGASLPAWSMRMITVPGIEP
jgi:hypothetical protein